MSLHSGSQFLSYYKEHLKDQYGMHKFVKAFKHGSRRAVAFHLPRGYNNQNYWYIFGRSSHAGNIPSHLRTVDVLVLDLISIMPVVVERNEYFDIPPFTVDEVEVYNNWNNPGVPSGRYRADLTPSSPAIKRLLSSIPKWEGDTDRLPPGITERQCDIADLKKVELQLRDPHLRHMFHLFVSSIP
jgi:hypothetical protein